MRRRTPSLLTAVLVVAATCGGLDNVLVHAEAQTKVPAGGPLDPLLGQIDFLGDFTSFDISDTQEFQNKGYTRDQIDSVHLNTFTLKATDPQDANFDFLDKISFFAESDGLPRVEIARLDPVPEGAAELDLEVLDVDLVDYATAESMSITTEASGHLPSEETTIDAKVELDVDVNVSGAACSVR